MNPQEIADALRVPFAQTDIKKRPDGYEYIDQECITSRLLDATGGVFDVVIQDGPRLVTYPKIKTGEAVSCWLAVVTINIPGLGSRTSVGTAQVLNEDAPKSCVTDALKKAATLFGCGLQLYEKAPQNAPRKAQGTTGQQSGQTRTATQSADRSGRSTNAPVAPNGQPLNDTGVQCPACHAPNLKPHQKGCKAVAAGV